MQNEPGGGTDVKNTLQRGSAMKVNPFPCDSPAFPASGVPVPIHLQICIFTENTMWHVLISS